MKQMYNGEKVRLSEISRVFLVVVNLGLRMMYEPDLSFMRMLKSLARNPLRAQACCHSRMC